jgi:DNA-binding response OmpR family regulator
VTLIINQVNSGKGNITSVNHCTEGNFVPSRETNPPLGRSILIAEEDPALASFLSRELEAGSYGVDLAHDGETALNALQNNRRYDLLILDLNLPGIDGVSLIRRVKPEKPRLAMMVLSARSRVEDKVLAFQSGADDFVAKPFSMLEVMARVQALLRRHSGLVPNASRVGDLTLQREEHRVERSGRQIDLTPREFAILDCLMRNAGRPVSRARLFEEVWKAPHDPSTNVVDVYVKYVRDKVDRPGERKLTHTIRGVGYELSDGYRGKQEELQASA